MFLDPSKDIQEIFQCCEGNRIHDNGIIYRVSTRNVKAVLKNQGFEHISPSYVFSLFMELDKKFHAFIKRPIKHDILYLYVDATYFSVRDGSAYMYNDIYLVIGITCDG